MASASQPPAKKRRVNEYFVASPTVKIWVGSEPKAWVIPEDLLCDRIDYFRAAFKGGFKESEQKEIHLKTDDPAIFAFVVDWIFDQKLDFTVRDQEDAVAVAEFQMHCCKLFVQADKLGVKKLPDEALDLLGSTIDTLGQPLDPKAIVFAYDNTIEKSFLRRRLIHKSVEAMFSARETNMSGWAAGTSANAEFNADVSKALRKHLLRTREGCEIKDCCVHDVVPF